MSDNAGNEAGNVQENSEKSENIQPNSEITPENEAPPSSDEGNSSSEGEKAPSSDDDDLALPEPDIAEDESKKKKEPPEWLKKKLERDRSAAERKAQEAARFKEENDRLKAALQPQGQSQPQNQQNQQPQIDPYMPQRAQFPDDATFFLALSDYREARRDQQAQFAHRQATIQKHEQEFHKNLGDAIESGKTKYKDFEERTDYILYGDGFPSNRAMAEAIVESKYKDDILYFLGTHVKEAERIAGLNPVSAAKEIAKIEVRFDSRKKSTIPKAPKPLSPLGGNSQGSGSHKNPDNMEMDEFRQWYKDKFG